MPTGRASLGLSKISSKDQAKQGGAESQAVHRICQGLVLIHVGPPIHLNIITKRQRLNSPRGDGRQPASFHTTHCHPSYSLQAPLSSRPLQTDHPQFLHALWLQRGGKSLPNSKTSTASASAWFSSLSGKFPGKNLSTSYKPCRQPTANCSIIAGHIGTKAILIYVLSELKTSVGV